MLAILAAGGLTAMIFVRLGWGNERYILICGFHVACLAAAATAGSAVIEVFRSNEYTPLESIIRNWCMMVLVLASLVLVTQVIGVLIALAIERPLENGILRLTAPVILMAGAWIGFNYTQRIPKVRHAAILTLTLVSLVQVGITVKSTWNWHNQPSNPHLVVSAGEVQGLRRLPSVPPYGGVPAEKEGVSPG